MLASSRHSAPCLINQSQILPLRRIELGRGAEDGERREAFIQQLVHDHPEVIPMAEVMIELARDGMTMVVVTHEMGFARNVANRVVFMDHGKVLENVEKDVFFTAPGERAQAFLSKLLSH